MNSIILDEELTNARTQISSASKKMFELRPLPAIAMQVSHACQDPDSSTIELARIVESDAAFAAKILQVVNSSLYGCSREVTTIRQALVVLGRKAVVQLAMSIAARTVFYSGKAIQDSRLALFDHSLGCAVIAKVIIAQEKLDIDPGTAFLAGIVHDVGKLILLDLAPNVYQRLIRNVDRQVPLFEAEHRLFGTDHRILGRELGETWGLGGATINVIAQHHEEDESQLPPLTRVVSLANQLSKKWGIGQEQNEHVSANTELWLGERQGEAIDEMRNASHECYDESKALLAT